MQTATRIKIAGKNFDSLPEELRKNVVVQLMMSPEVPLLDAGSVIWSGHINSESRAKTVFIPKGEIAALPITIVLQNPKRIYEITAAGVVYAGLWTKKEAQNWASALKCKFVQM